MCTERTARRSEAVGILDTNDSTFFSISSRSVEAVDRQDTKRHNRLGATATDTVIPKQMASSVVFPFKIRKISQVTMSPSYRYDRSKKNVLHLWWLIVVVHYIYVDVVKKNETVHCVKPHKVNLKPYLIKLKNLFPDLKLTRLKPLKLALRHPVSFYRIQSPNTSPTPPTNPCGSTPGCGARGTDGNLSRPPELRLQVRALNESGTLAACKMPPEIIIKCRPIYRSDPCPETPFKLPLSYLLKALYFVVRLPLSFLLLSCRASFDTIAVL
ncbi:unnamed protein product [Pieris macdunnoughi]|uniref:Uncharacterized protein n=1 Tax=Pieris macdunnoughi TaxID=345717 RepID=A0A821LZS4_9NEOP|nr:unnamed protein product [Pieris macdunnoughi]